MLKIGPFLASCLRLTYCNSCTMPFPLPYFPAKGKNKDSRRRYGSNCKRCHAQKQKARDRKKVMSQKQRQIRGHFNLSELIIEEVDYNTLPPEFTSTISSLILHGMELR